MEPPRVNAYAFLSKGRTSLFTATTWPPPGEWLEGPGVRATTADHLLSWIDDELWACELSGAVALKGELLTAERARLGERVLAWDESAARDLTEACVARALTHAIERLRTAEAGEANVLSGLGPDEFASIATGVAARLPERAAETVLFAADVVALSRGRRPEEYDAPSETRGAPTPAAVAANVAYVVAHIAGTVASDGYDVGVAKERGWQLAWLHERLGS